MPSSRSHERPLHALDRARRTVECRENTVARRIDLGAMMFGEDISRDPVVLIRSSLQADHPDRRASGRADDVEGKRSSSEGGPGRAGGEPVTNSSIAVYRLAIDPRPRRRNVVRLAGNRSRDDPVSAGPCRERRRIVMDRRLEPSPGLAREWPEGCATSSAPFSARAQRRPPERPPLHTTKDRVNDRVIGAWTYASTVPPHVLAGGQSRSSARFVVRAHPHPRPTDSRVSHDSRLASPVLALGSGVDASPRTRMPWILPRSTGARLARCRRVHDGAMSSARSPACGIVTRFGHASAPLVEPDENAQSATSVDQLHRTRFVPAERKMRHRAGALTISMAHARRRPGTRCDNHRFART